MPFIDFAAVKEAVSIEQAVQKLGLKVVKSSHQLRGACPTCNSGGDRALAITPAKNLFFCFASQTGGDQIALAAHVRDISTKDAAEWLGGTSTSKGTSTSDSTSTVRKDRATDEGGFKPLDYLDAAHPAVEAVGFDQETAEALGIGYANKGILKGTVAIPLRLPDGTLAGYAGITEARLPKEFHLGNVVRFQPKKSA